MVQLLKVSALVGIGLLSVSSPASAFANQADTATQAEGTKFTTIRRCRTVRPTGSRVGKRKCSRVKVAIEQAASDTMAEAQQTQAATNG